jgi:transcriptional regulator with XRE-family HTH domain
LLFFTSLETLPPVNRNDRRLMMTPPQCRAARALLGWSQEELAAAAHVSIGTIRNFESGKSMPMYNTIGGIKRALEDAGVAFIMQNGGGPGVRLRKPL